jgi:hypothetical protein
MKARIAPAAIVLTVAAATLCSLGSASYQRGRQTAPLARFLDPRLAPTIDEAFVSFPVEYALRSDEANDIVFLGDSVCHDDVDPARLSGLKSYNLGSLGSVGPLGILLTAEAYLDHHSKPRLVVLCISPLRFEVNSGSAGGHVARRLVANYGPEVAGVVPLTQILPYFIRRGAIEARGRAGGVALLDKPLRGMDSESFISLGRRMSDTRGFFALPGEHGGRWSVESPAPQPFILDEWKDGVRRLDAACKASGVPLVVRFGPIWSGVSKSRDFAALESWADQLEDSSANVRVSRPIVLAWDRDVMWDCLHLNAAGVARFMPIVAKDVQQAIAR